MLDITLEILLVFLTDVNQSAPSLRQVFTLERFGSDPADGVAEARVLRRSKLPYSEPRQSTSANGNKHVIPFNLLVQVI